MATDRLRCAAWMLALLLVAWAADASASPMRVDLTGTITNVKSPLTSVKIGDTFQETFTYDPSTPAQSYSTSTTGYYFGPLLSGSFNIGKGKYVATDCVHVHSDGGNEIMMSNNSNGDAWTSIVAYDSVTAPNLDGHSLYDWLILYLHDSTSNVFSGTALPSPLPSLSHFSNSEVSWHFDSSSADLFVLGTVQSYTVTPTPEPATLGLLAIGGLGAILRRRCRNGSAK
jgi:hypothetical protein